MLIATFNETTGWVGKTIIREGGAFLLEGYGQVTAADVMRYDGQGDLLWAGDGLRGWVASLAELPQREAAHGASSGASLSPLPIIRQVRHQLNAPDVFRAIVAATGALSDALELLSKDAEQGRVRVRVLGGLTHWGGEIEVCVAGGSEGGSYATYIYAPKMKAKQADQFVIHSQLLDRLMDTTQSVMQPGSSPRLPPSQRPYYKIPAAALMVYSAYGGPTDVEAVSVGYLGLCLVALPESCVIVGSRYASYPASYVEFSYADVGDILLREAKDCWVVDIRRDGYQVPTEGPQAEYLRNRPNCFLTKNRRGDLVPLLDELRSRCGLSDSVTGVVTVVRRCRLDGGHGYPIAVGAVLNLLFGSDEIAIFERRDGRIPVRIPYSAVRVLEVLKQPAVILGTDLGQYLAASNDGADLSTVVPISTIHLRTDAAELFVGAEESADALTMRLSRVFEKLRGLGGVRSQPAVGSQGASTDLVDQLARLTEMHKAGELTDEEFASFKAKLRE